MESAFLYSMYAPASRLGDDPSGVDPAFFIHCLDFSLCLLGILRLDKSNDGWTCTGERRRPELTGSFICCHAA